MLHSGGHIRRHLEQVGLRVLDDLEPRQSVAGAGTAPRHVVEVGGTHGGAGVARNRRSGVRQRRNHSTESISLLDQGWDMTRAHLEAHSSGAFKTW